MKSVLLLAIVLPCAAQDYYYCVDANGTPVFSDQRCGPVSQVKSLKEAQSVANEYGVPNGDELNRRLNALVINEANYRQQRLIRNRVSSLSNELNQQLHDLQHKNTVVSALQMQAIASQYGTRIQTLHDDLERIKRR